MVYSSVSVLLMQQLNMNEHFPNFAKLSRINGSILCTPTAHQVQDVRHVIRTCPLYRRCSAFMLCTPTMFASPRMFSVYFMVACPTPLCYEVYSVQYSSQCCCMFGLCHFIFYNQGDHPSWPKIQNKVKTDSKGNFTHLNGLQMRQIGMNIHDFKAYSWILQLHQ